MRAEKSDRPEMWIIKIFTNLDENANLENTVHHNCTTFSHNLLSLRYVQTVTSNWVKTVQIRLTWVLRGEITAPCASNETKRC